MENQKTLNFTLYGDTAQYDRIFDEIKQIPDTWSPEEIINEVQKKISLAIILGMPVQKQILEKFTFYRVRSIGLKERIKENKASSFYYPPDTSKIKRGRANCEGQQVFYASGDPHTPFHEMASQITPNSSIVYLSKWGLKDFPTEVFMRNLFLGTIESDDKDYASIMASGLNEMVDGIAAQLPEHLRGPFIYCQQRYTDIFTAPGSDLYHISSAIAHDTFSSFVQQGVNLPIIAYPSVAKNKRAVNFAIRKDFADKYLYLREVEKLIVTELGDKSIKFTLIQRGIPTGNKIRWYRPKAKIISMDYENALISHDKKDGQLNFRRLKESESLTSCCQKHSYTVREFLQRNKFTKENILKAINSMPKEAFDYTQKIQSDYFAIAETTGNVFLSSDTSEACRVTFINVPVKYVLSFE